MPKEQLVYRGWIGAKEIDRIELEAIGVKVDGWNPIGAFDYCSATVEVYKVFCSRWKGRGVWGMIGRKELVYQASDYKQNQMPGDEDIPF
jgi:hypothetical protein